MKIVSYNLNRYNRAKLAHVLAIGADVYVLPECADKGIVGEVEGYRMEWMGNYDIKGLAVLVRDGIDYEVPEWFIAKGDACLSKNRGTRPRDCENLLGFCSYTLHYS